MGIATDGGSGEAVGNADVLGEGDGDAVLLPLPNSPACAGCVTANAAAIATIKVRTSVKRFNVFEILNL